MLIFMPAIFAADHHTPTQTQLSSQTERPDEETKIIFCRSNWDADEESGKLYVKMLDARLGGVPEVAIRMNLEQFGLLDTRMGEIIRIAYHDTKLSTSRKIVEMCKGWALE